ncbi:MAG: efflux RND transporter periplasmic adaptor subunit [Ignavibacteriaceae bacterium]|nr:efflux RND transporter periplasmic adaptor subunit [Ignavibacteriaceae bacterium]
MQYNRKFIGWIFVFGILALLLVPKLKLSNKNNSKITNRDPKLLSTLVDVWVVKAKPLQNKIFSNGTLISNEEVELRSEISGKVTGIMFTEGKRVKKGDILVKINDSELQAALKKNKSKELLARDREFRYKQLLEKNLTSQQEYDLQLSELNSVLADVELTEAQIAKTEITAPFDGIVGLRSVSVGSYISPLTKIASLQSINPMKVEFAVPQKYFGLIKEGKAIYIKLSATGKTYAGKIYAVEPKINENTRTVQARAIVPNNNGELTPGAYVEIDIVLENLTNAILIPSEAVVPDFEGEKVFIYKNGKAVSQLVTAGIRTEKEIQITSGLNIGDSIIVSGIIQLKPNGSVKIKKILD